MLLRIPRHLDLANTGDSNYWAACLVMFYGMLRRSNVLPESAGQFDPSHNLRRKDIVFGKGGLTVMIRWSKTIQFGDRVHKIPLPRIADSALCPSQAVYHAFQKSPLAKTNGPSFVCLEQPSAKPLTVNQFLCRLKNILGAEGIDPSAFGGHSFRRGGASWAFQSGVPIETIRLIGDWKSNCCTINVWWKDWVVTQERVQ